MSPIKSDSPGHLLQGQRDPRAGRVGVPAGGGGGGGGYCQSQGCPAPQVPCSIHKCNVL